MNHFYCHKIGELPVIHSSSPYNDILISLPLVTSYSSSFIFKAHSLGWPWKSVELLAKKERNLPGYGASALKNSGGMRRTNN